MGEIKLLVSCHKAYPVPSLPWLFPIQVGAALAEPIDGLLRDDTGENISLKNRSYCELTAQYWAWKNVQADYYGFFHYRRYLYPDQHARRPYRIEARPSTELLSSLGWEQFPALIERYDLIAAKGEDMHIPVREHYAKAPYHHSKDLTLAENLVRTLSQEYAAALDEHLSQTVCYFGNIFIMSGNLFRRYCDWLFPVLAAFDAEADLTGYGQQERRVDGYLAERLFGVFYTKVKAEGAKTLELPRVDFIPEAKARYKRQILNAILPPGTARRAAIKGWRKSE